ncbi:hypothetical protein [Streptomyces candidus]|uniref:Secreted protein n=1 Tax=Streptomyces candidus TaxID=67283 RepID=A0A7X0HA06_9ACTN|nr:hypothetical protein [Streptomyces candidus]MBB6433670.1 hypothetical protein [Streptomyces candidus]GHH35030.1 hypothetical protein GCM10018773_08100 [Streptomyces candidus]
MAAVASLAAGFVAAMVSPAPGAHAAAPADQLGSLPVSGELLDEVADTATDAVTGVASQAGPAAGK